ncbi:MAG TPA: ferrous iron transport protein A [Firmicutes bacterium]|nr:ferrous iron transport protein A [Bacillota bacterium]
MSNLFSLNELATNESGEIAYIHKDSIMRHRLWDLGFTKGAKVRILYTNPSGSPRAYLIRESVIALRNEDASSIKIELEQNREGVRNEDGVNS